MEVKISPKGEGLTVLCLGAHADDIEIGCGGTLLQLKAKGYRLKFHWVVFSATGNRRAEACKAAEAITAGCEKQIVLKEFRDGFLPYRGAEVKDFFEQLKVVNPDLIFTHWNGDAHQDHRLVCELTWNTFRQHMILEYEIPKYDGDLGRPNVFFPIEKQCYEEKLRVLNDSFVSQNSKPWFETETFLGLMRLRGMESSSPTRYAEAFYSRKTVINLL